MEVVKSAKRKVIKVIAIENYSYTSANRTNYHCLIRLKLKINCMSVCSKFSSRRICLHFPACTSDTQTWALLPVDEPPPDTALEETTAAVAGIDAVVFPAAGVAAHFAHQGWTHGFARRRALSCGSNRRGGGREKGSFSMSHSSWHCFTRPCHLHSELCSTRTAQYCNRRLGPENLQF